VSPEPVVAERQNRKEKEPPAPLANNYDTVAKVLVLSNNPDAVTLFPYYLTFYYYAAYNFS
jgi:hypothetical protein